MYLEQIGWKNLGYLMFCNKIYGFITSSNKLKKEKKIPEIFSEGLGFRSKVKAKFELKENVTPVFRPKRQVRGSLNKFPDFFHMGTFIDSTHMKL